MKDIIINVDSISHKVNFPDEFLGIGYENLQGNIIFQFDNNFIGGEARLEVSIDEESGIIPSLTHYENGYILPIKSSLLTGTNVLMQLVIDETSLTKYTLTTDTQVNQNKTYYEKVGNDYLPVENPNAHDLPTYYEANTPVFKTDIFSLKVKDSINAQETIPEQYPTWINTFNILVATLNQKLLLVDQALTEMDNLNISVSNKVNGEVTITFTDKEGNVKVVKINDGRGIVSITKTGTSENIDTYTITYTDNTTSTFQVTNGIDGTDGVGIESIYLTGTSGLTDTYTILYTDGTTTEFQVKNGRGITKIEKISTNLLVDTYKITFNDGTTQNYELTNGKGIVSIEKTSTDGLTDIYTITYNDNTTTTFNVVNGKGIISIEKTSTSGYVDTYTITYNDGTTTTYEVTNGEVSQAQLDALQDELNYYKTIVNALPKITGSGTSITLNNTANSILSNILNPNIYQETTTGKNLMENQRETEEVNGVTFTRNADGSITLNGTASANTDYVFTNTTGASTNNQNLGVGTYLLTGVTDGTTSTYYLQMAVYDGTSTDYNSQFITAKTVTVSTASTFRCYIVVKSGAVFNNKTIYPMLRLSSITDDSYEQYTGGIPAPNPQFPMPIHSVSGNNIINVCGKNLANINSIENIDIATYKLTITNDTIVLSNNTSPNGYSSTNKTLHELCPNLKVGDIAYLRFNTTSTETNKNNIWLTSPASILWTKDTSKTITQDMLDGIVVLYGGSSGTAIISNFMITTLSDTTYTPHEEQNILIPLGNIEYCKIGNFADRFFKNVVDDIDYSDTLILGAWYIKKNIGKIVLNGSESGWYAEGQRYRIDNIINAMPFNIFDENNILAYCENFRWANGSANNYVYGAFWYTLSGTSLSFQKDENPNSTTLEQFKIWLSNNNQNVRYVTATPTYTQITGNLETALETANNQMLAYKSQTYISQINNDLPFIIDSTALKDLTNL